MQTSTPEAPHEAQSDGEPQVSDTLLDKMSGSPDDPEAIEARERWAKVNEELAALGIISLAGPEQKAAAANPEDELNSDAALLNRELLDDQKDHAAAARLFLLAVAIHMADRIAAQQQAAGGDSVEDQAATVQEEPSETTPKKRESAKRRKTSNGSIKNAPDVSGVNTNTVLGTLGEGTHRANLLRDAEDSLIMPGLAHDMYEQKLREAGWHDSQPITDELRVKADDAMNSLAGSDTPNIDRILAAYQDSTDREFSQEARVDIRNDALRWEAEVEARQARSEAAEKPAESVSTEVAGVAEAPAAVPAITSAESTSAAVAPISSVAPIEQVAVAPVPVPTPSITPPVSTPPTS